MPIATADFGELLTAIPRLADISYLFQVRTMKKNILIINMLLGAIAFGNSFETRGDLSSMIGRVSLDTNIYRFGRSSLRWEAKSHEGITLPLTSQKNSRRAVSFQLYNPKVNEFGKLKVNIGDAAKGRDYAFEIPLNFENWRLIRIDAEKDLQWISNAQATDSITITYSGNYDTALYIDAFVPGASWQRTPSLQLPFINARAPAMHSDEIGANLISNYCKQIQKFKADMPATSEQIAAINQLRQQAADWLLNSTISPDNQLMGLRHALILKEARHAWQLYQQMCIEHAGAVFHFKSGEIPKDGYDMMWSEITNDMLLPLVYAYKLQIIDNELYGKQEVKTAIIDILGLLHYQGFAAGADHNWHIIFAVRGIGQSIFLMTSELRQAGLLEPLTDALLWYSRFVNLASLPVALTPPSADLLRATLIEAFFGILALDDDQAAVCLQSFKTVMDRQLRVTGGITDFIKTDGSAFHHGQVAHAYYGPDGLHGAAAIAYLLRNTPYELDKSSLDELCRALLVFDQQHNEYDTPTVTNVRWPFFTGAAKTVVPAYAYMILLNPDNRTLGEVFRRLYRPGALKEMCGETLRYQNTVGEIRALEDADKFTNDLVASSPAEGCFNFFNSALLIQRRDHWMAAIRGFSKYAWDFEVGSRSPQGYENKYGRFLSHGRLQIFANGKNATQSGYVDSGWDFSHQPGTTSLAMMPADLELPPGLTYGRNYSTATFVGGGEINQQNGIYAFDMQDPVFVDFTAFKSYHLASNCIVALGSGICNQVGEYDTDTTIFQNYIGGDSEEYPVQKVFSEKATILIDSLNTAYYIPARQQLTVTKQKQTGPDERGKSIRSGFFEKAIIHHGRAPKNASYEYAILINPASKAVSELSSKAPYEVLQANAAAHIVYFPAENLISAAVAQADVDLPFKLPVRQMSRKGLLLCQSNPQNKQLTISVTDPDFGWQISPDQVSHAEMADPVAITLQLRGDWLLVSGKAEIREDICQLSVIPGKSTQIVITPR
jgi:chondroitin-sulfate-ABC endolyase/exolyase